MSARLCIIADTALRARAERLAQALGVPLRERAHADDTLALQLDAAGLGLRDLHRPREAPFAVDFTAPRTGSRLRRGGGMRETLARALGVRRGVRPRVLDATAGWGRDAFVLAALGCEVTLLERNAVIAALLRDGLARGGRAPGVRAIVARMTLVEDDAALYLRRLHGDAAPEAIYLDPMYPPGGKRAAVKKDTRLLRALAGDTAPAPDLLAAARACARERVAVKRPAAAGPLESRAPDTSLRSVATRYDIYLCRNRPPA